MQIIAAIMLVLASTTTAAADSSWVPLSIDRAGAIIVPVRINDSGPFLFLLDTGASHSVISESLTARLKLELVARTMVTTTTGRETRPVARINRTSIGTVRAEQILASVAPAAQLASIARGIDGIIGQDFLFSVNYTLDYRRRRIIWTDAASADKGTRLPLIARQGRYLVQVAIPGSDAPVLLVPDSGANGFVIFARNGRTPVPLGSTPQRSFAHSLSGRQDVRTMVVRELQIGDVTVVNQPVAVIARDGGDALEGDGLLPLHVFASVSFNAREQCLIVRRQAE